MTTYIGLKTLILNNRYTYDDMHTKLDMFYSIDRITFDQHFELVGLMVKPEPVVEEVMDMPMDEQGEI